MTISEIRLTDFGVLADGQTDDTVAIRQAMSAVPPEGARVVLPLGVMLYSDDIAVPDGVEFVGKGGEFSVFRWGGGTAVSAKGLVLGASTDCTFHGVGFDLDTPNVPGGANFGRMVWSQDAGTRGGLEFRSCRFTNSQDVGEQVHTNNTPQAILARGTSNIVFRDCYVEALQVKLHGPGLSVENIDVRGNHFHRSQNYGLSVVSYYRPGTGISGLYVTDNRFSGGGDAGQCYIGDEGCTEGTWLRDCVIARNHFEGSLRSDNCEHLIVRVPRETQRLVIRDNTIEGDEHDTRASGIELSAHRHRDAHAGDVQVLDNDIRGARLGVSVSVSTRRARVSGNILHGSLVDVVSRPGVTHHRMELDNEVHGTEVFRPGHGTRLLADGGSITALRARALVRGCEEGVQVEAINGGKISGELSTDTQRCTGKGLHVRWSPDQDISGLRLRDCVSRGNGRDYDYPAATDALDMRSGV